MGQGSENKQEKATTIIVNARQKEWLEEEITFAQVVVCAFPTPPFGENTLFTVTYNRGHGPKPQGTMVEGGEPVRVKKGMVFNVSATDKS